MSSPGPQSQQPTPSNNSTPAANLEMASVLFMDIVSYSQEPMERQSSLLHQLQTIVRDTVEFKRAHQSGQLISLPTGDGFALVFFDNPTVPVQCALEVCRALKQRPDIRLRMGVHTGPVYRIADINANMNVAGGGINMAQRVMDCGDAGHILVSSAVADVLSHLSGWPEKLKDLGEHRVKHGVKMHLYAICADEVTNQELPQKLRAAVAPPPTQGSRRLWIGAGVVVALAAVAAVAAGFFALRPGSVAPTSVSTGAPVAERTLAYWVVVQKYREGKPFQTPFRLAKDINFEPNYGIQLGFSSPQSGYLYLVNEGPELKNGQPDYHVLFPSPVMNEGSPRVGANSEIHVPPDGRNFIRFDEQQGTEKLWVVWAKDEPPVLASAVKAASFRPEDGGGIKDSARVTELANFLSTKSKNAPKVTQDDANRQSVVTAADDVLVFLRKLEHH